METRHVSSFKRLAEYEAKEPESEGVRGAKRPSRQVRARVRVHAFKLSDGLHLVFCWHLSSSKLSQDSVKSLEASTYPKPKTLEILWSARPVTAYDVCAAK